MYVDCHKSIRYANYGPYAPLPKANQFGWHWTENVIVCNLAEFDAFCEKYKGPFLKFDVFKSNISNLSVKRPGKDRDFSSHDI